MRVSESVNVDHGYGSWRFLVQHSNEVAASKQQPKPHTHTHTRTITASGMLLTKTVRKHKYMTIAANDSKKLIDPTLKIQASPASSTSKKPRRDCNAITHTILLTQRRIQAGKRCAAVMSVLRLMVICVEEVPSSAAVGSSSRPSFGYGWFGSFMLDMLLLLPAWWWWWRGRGRVFG